MGRAPCCDKASVKRGPWSPEEDAKLKAYIEKHGTGGNWIALPQKIGLKRCGKSCRLRWLNYLRPNIKHGGFSEEEEIIICSLYMSIGSRWSIIAAQLPGRTDNDIKNYWNTRLKRKLLGKHQLREQHCSRKSTIPRHQILKDEVENVKVVDPQQAMMSSTPYFPEMIPLVKSENYQCPINYGFSISLQDQMCGNSSMDFPEHRSGIDSSTSDGYSQTSTIDFDTNMAVLGSCRGPGNYYFPDQPTEELTAVYGNRGRVYDDEFTSLYQPTGLDSNTVDMSSSNCNHPTISDYEDGLQDVLESMLTDPSYFGPQ